MEEFGPLVSAAALADRLRDPSVRIVHVSVDLETYPLRHLPGAVFSDLHVDLAGSGTSPDTGTVPRMYMTPDREHVQAVLARWGVGEGDDIVFYDDVGQNRYGIRGYWLLRRHGFPADRVHILDGGLPVWEKAALPTTAEARVPASNPSPVLLGPADDSLEATAEQVLGWTREPGTRVLDVRTIDEYLGRDVRARRGGRIPGALHRLWTDFLTLEGTIRPAADCLATVRASGVEPGEVRAVYCQGGVRAALVWFVLHELAGLAEVRNYAGSWEEWGNRLDLPVDIPGESAVTGSGD